MKTIIDELKSWLFQLELRAEQSSALAFGLYLVFLVLMGSVILFDILNVLQAAPSFLFPILYAAFVLFIIGVDYVHFTMAKSYRFELDARKRFIAELHEPQKRLYKIMRWHQKYIIEKNGDGLNIRSVRLGYRNKDVTCYEMTFGTNSRYGLDLARSNVKAFSLPDRLKLPRVTFNVAATDARTLIILANPLSKRNPECELMVRVPIPKVWDDLIRTGRDEGNLVLNHPTEELILEFVAPQGYRFEEEELRFSPDEGVRRAYRDNDGNSCLEYSINEPTLGLHEFEIAVGKTS